MIPYGRQLIEEDDLEAVAEVLRSSYLTTGPLVERFEEAFSGVTGAASTIVCNSGTAALHLASMAADLGEGDVAIVPAITFLATANAPSMTGAQIVFADVDPDTGLLTRDTLLDALDRADAVGNARAVLPVHLNGHCVDMPEIADIARSRGMVIIEDACHALGGNVPGPGNELVPVGACAFSDMAAFSFHPVKTIAMGEGGAVTTNNATAAERMQLLRNHGMTRNPDEFQRTDQAYDSSGGLNPWYYEMTALGWNYRAPDINCALGLSQLSKLERFARRRRELASRYAEQLGELAPIVQPVMQHSDQDPVCHLMAILIDFAKIGLSRRDMMVKLLEEGIGTQVHYIPVPDQPYWRGAVDTPPLPGAKNYYERILSLPLHVAMTDADVDAVCNALSDIVRS